MAFLEVNNLSVHYGMIQAIRGVSFHVNEGEIVALIGANGAGKTTIMHSVCNLIPKSSGHVSFEEHDITNVPAHKLVPMGIAQVPEGRRIFQELTVAENLRMGAYTRHDDKEIAETLSADNFNYCTEYIGTYAVVPAGAGLSEQRYFSHFVAHLNG